MDFRKEFVVEPGAKVRLSKIDPSHKGKYESREQAAPDIAKNMQRMDKLQYLLCADDSQSLLIVLQALDAGGKDGTVRHVFSGMNPQGTRAFDFKQPSKEELAHDFLWRAHMHTPAKGQDVLVVRVHDLVPQSVWSKRYDLISDFEKMLSANGTHVLKFYLHISPEGQLARFAQRLDDPARNWKFSESDYSERALWPQYLQAYEDAIALTTTKRAVVRHSGEPQVVSRHRDITDHRGYDGRNCRPRRSTSRTSAASIMPRCARRRPTASPGPKRPRRPGSGIRISSHLYGAIRSKDCRAIWSPGLCSRRSRSRGSSPRRSVLCLGEPAIKN
jgi:PPK2 family polyphosphate:nucleotide phosphotransferase